MKHGASLSRVFQTTGRPVVVGLVAAVLLVAGCRRPAYMPDITLPQQGTMIDAAAELHDVTLAPGIVSGKDTFGLDAPKAKHVEPRALLSDIEAELLKELNAAGVFARVVRFDPHPDVLLAGRIDALYERTHPQVWTYVPGIDTVTKVLHLKSHVSSGEADVTLFVLKPNGERLGAYRGKASFRETFNPTDDVPPGARLNRALSDALQQIQTHMLRDARLRQVASR